MMNANDRMKLAGRLAARNDEKHYGRDYVRRMVHLLTESSFRGVGDDYAEGYRAEFNKSGHNLDRGRRI